jgi:hypothetical protein
VVDVFLRTMVGEQQNSLRRAFRRATVVRWEMEDVHLHYLSMGIREGRLWAERTATSDIYIFSDDDVLPWGKDWLERGLLAMGNNPEFAACSSRSVIAEERGNYEIPQGVEILPVPCVGAPLWMRRGILGPDLPEFLFVEECIVLHNYLLKKGFKEGIISGLEHHHLGFGFATTPNLVRGY